ncbi:MAG: hypothetical protein DRJ42_13895 [Deltaproteobacteria bacterium]|nr:MAG: hypothetical protein DRJ42_13895 [Deltaproteobacteria bacterium]
MDRVLAGLIEAGLLDEETARWVHATLSERGGVLSDVLLELDVVDEETLLRALSARHEIPAAEIDDLGHIDRELAGRIPLSVSTEYSLCPIRFAHYGVLVWVTATLSGDKLGELREAAGLEVHQRVAARHHVAVARARLYGALGELEDRTRRLEVILERRRGAVALPVALEKIAKAPTLLEAIGAASDFVAGRLEVSTFFVEAIGGLRVVGMRGAEPEGPRIAMPEPGCTFAAALRYGGYFLGPVAGSDADRLFFEAFGRAPARRAFVAPLPTLDGGSVLFFGENGPRAISPRLAAEISLLAARLAQRGESWGFVGIGGGTPEEAIAAESEVEEAEGPERGKAEGGELPVEDSEDSEPESVKPESVKPESVKPESVKPESVKPESVKPDAREPRGTAPPAAEVVAPEVVAPDSPAVVPESGAPLSGPAVTDAERAVLDRLTAASVGAGLDLETFVEGLLNPAAPAAPPMPPSALAGEVKDLFEKLATDIPTQLARGMEAAFRDLAPRIAAGAAPVASAPAAAARPSAAASAELVIKQPTGPREVATYRSRRSKTKRVKL